MGAPEQGGAKGLLDWADLVVASALFAALTALTWRRWATFLGDINREWTTPMRLAAGERLYRDVGFYYGPVGPHLGALAMRLFGSRTGTLIGLGLVSSVGTIGTILLGARAFLPLSGRIAVAAVTIGVFAFAPRNGAFIACYSLSALLAVWFAWAAYVLAGKGRPVLAGILGGLAVLSKIESAPALLAAGLRLAPRRALALGLVAGGIAAAGYAWACRGIPMADLVSYGPLRHFRMPPEFQELYIRSIGLHPVLRERGITRALLGAALLLCWVLAVSGVFSKRLAWAAAGCLGLVSLLVVKSRLPESLLTVGARGLPVVLVVATVVACVTAVRAKEGSAERREAGAVAAAGVLGLAFGWRTFFWNVPMYAYAPLAAISGVPAVAWLAGVVASRPVPETRRALSRVLLLLPLLAAPVAAFPGLVEAYRAHRIPVETPLGRWIPPDPEGELYGKVLAHLARVGVADRSLVAMPEAGVVGFLLGVRSPLRFEQFLPGHVDGRMDRELAEAIDKTRPKRIVFVARPTPEFGSMKWGVDYCREISSRLSRDYVEEVRFNSVWAIPNWGWAAVYVRREP